MDEDSIQFDLKPLDFEEGKYPMLSFCLFDPFIESRLKIYNDTLTAEKYKNMSLGLSSYNGAENIDFDDVTIDLADFYLGDAFKFQNGSDMEKIDSDFRKDFPHETGSFAWDLGFMKCFGLRSKFTNIQYVSFAFNSSFYPNGIRPSLNLHTAVGVHLPNQLSMVGNSFMYAWPKRNERREHTMEFSLQQIDILKRRNKRNDPCISDDFNFDQII